LIKSNLENELYTQKKEVLIYYLCLKDKESQSFSTSFHF